MVFSKDENKFEPINNFKTSTGVKITFDEQVIALDVVNGQLYVTTVNKMYRLKQSGSSVTPVRIW